MRGLIIVVISISISIATVFAQPHESGGAGAEALVEEGAIGQGGDAHEQHAQQYQCQCPVEHASSGHDCRLEDKIAGADEFKLNGCWLPGPAPILAGARIEGSEQRGQQSKAVRALSVVALRKGALASLFPSAWQGDRLLSMGSTKCYSMATDGAAKDG